MTTDVASPEPATAEKRIGMLMNTAPAGAAAIPDQGFLKFLRPLHERFTPRQQQLIAKRHAALQASHAGRRPEHLPPSEATQGDWKIELPAWCQDQRNQMTGPADDAEL